MDIIRSFFAAFSMYSRIPVPRALTGDGDTGLMMAFFPVVGLVTGALQYLFFLAASLAGLSAVFTAAVMLCIPLIVTGGIHMDGFADMSDALSSYKSQGERLDIMKDPHIGAFAVIKSIVLVLMTFGALYETASSGDKRMILMLGASLVLSRVAGSFTVLYARCAKEEGSLFHVRKAAKKAAVTVLLVLEGVAAVMFAVYINLIAGILMISVMACAVIMCNAAACKTLGGVTGDTAGWMLCITECAAACAVALSCHPEVTGVLSAWL